MFTDLEIDIYDVDDVLLDFAPFLQIAMADTTGIDSNWKEWKTYDLHERVYKCTLKEFFDNSIKGGALELSEFNPDNVVLDMICPERENHVVTNRGWHPQAFSLTYRHTKHLVPEVDNYHFLVPFVSLPKDAYIIDNFILPHGKRVRRVFEDSPSTTRQLLAYYDDCPHLFHEDFHVVLVDRPWNQGIEHERCVRITSEYRNHPL